MLLIELGRVGVFEFPGCFKIYVQIHESGDYAEGFMCEALSDKRG